jgi:succinoglycan biosynthesis transport protein ExoP
MDTIDRSNTNLPAPLPANLPIYRDMTPALPVDQAGSPGLQVNPRVILRGLTRHWWKILGLWLLMSIPIVLTIRWYIQPTYEASSLLKIEPSALDLFNINSRLVVENQNSTHLKTQVTVLKSDQVLEPTVANALVVNLPMIKNSADPKNDLRQKLSVAIVEGTNVIRVALELPNRDEAVTIVKAVIQAYLTKYMDTNRMANRNLTESMNQEQKKLKEQIDLTRSTLKKLNTEGKVAAFEPPDMRFAKTDVDPMQPVLTKVAEDQYVKFIDRLAQCDFDCLEALSHLEAAKLVRARNQNKIDEELVPKQALYINGLQYIS